MKLQNVIGVGGGWKRIGGRYTESPALVVMVKKKKPVEQIPAGHVVPRVVGGWPTDVVETGEFTAFQRTSRVRPAVPGVSIGNFRGATGTFGAVVFGRRGQPAILSNNHILANATNGRDGRASLGDAVIQPGIADGGAAPGDTIGFLRAFVPLRFLS